MGSCEVNQTNDHHYDSQPIKVVSFDRYQFITWVVSTLRQNPRTKLYTEVILVLRFKSERTKVLF